MYNAIIDFLGPVPVGMEPVVYIFSMLVTIFLLNSLLEIVSIICILPQNTRACQFFFVLLFSLFSDKFT